MSADLTTTYLGLSLASPLVASSSPLTGDVDSLRTLADMGAGAVVLPSLFEEEVTRGDERVANALWSHEARPGAAAAYMTHVDRTHLDAYLDLVRDASRELEIPVIASLNGSTPGGWTRSAELLQLAGASAIELNVYSVESDANISGAGVEERTLRLVHAVRQVVTVPIAVKLSPFYTAFANVAQRLAEARVDGLVLFNRFVQPDVDPGTLEVAPGLDLSRREELKLALRWLAILRGRVDTSLAATGGVHTSEDAAKAILVGADAVMLASALLRDGPVRLRDVRRGLEEWLEEHGLTLAGARGRLSDIACGDTKAYERAQYVQTLLGSGVPG
jgi:dihydroorotate dehydrogenase (fumarate)